ncbi:MAG: hypothetical protein TREMPRED_001914 [Tremellales sp. Tagirdzhanova-0007]|nr:MAG: hypothetical protein TREMPRED_001914 [Tremellales sp. Tagirdzhanova-0007]
MSVPGNLLQRTRGINYLGINRRYCQNVITRAPFVDGLKPMRFRTSDQHVDNTTNHDMFNKLIQAFSSTDSSSLDKEMEQVKNGTGLSQSAVDRMKVALEHLATPRIPDGDARAFVGDQVTNNLSTLQKQAADVAREPSQHTDSIYSLPIIKRYVTTTNAAGLSVFGPTRACDHLEKKLSPSGRKTGWFHNIWVQKYAPTEGSLDLSSTTGLKCLVEDEGVNFRETIIAPLAEGGMHKTASRDFLVVTKGRPTLCLDSGEEVEIEEGSVIVQNGTNHAWKNKSATEVVRMVVVLLSADERGRSGAKANGGDL